MAVGQRQVKLGCLVFVGTPIMDGLPKGVLVNPSQNEVLPKKERHYHRSRQAKLFLPARHVGSMTI